MSVEEFKNILSESKPYFTYGDYTKKYDNISKQFAYINCYDLNSYVTCLPTITTVTTKEITAEDVDYHKSNLMKIIKLWAPLHFNRTDNYINPTPQLKKLIEETNALASEGMEKIDEKI